MLAETLGAGLGSALGGVSDVLSMPRRALWSGVAGLMGQEAPESGSELLGNLGMDRDSMLTDALGFGVEALTDPLTYAGGLLGRLGGKALGGGAAAAESAGSPLASALKGGDRLDRVAGSGLQNAMAKKVYDRPLQPGPFKFDQDVLRSDQLNSPFFRPDLPAYNLGTPEFTQVASEGLQAGGGLADRLSRMMPQLAGV